MHHQIQALTSLSSIVEFPPTTVASPTISDIESSKVIPSHDFTRLPKLNIPTFSRDALQRQSIWDCFEAAVHYNRSITGMQKLRGLRLTYQWCKAWFPRITASWSLNRTGYKAHALIHMRKESL